MFLLMGPLGLSTRVFLFKHSDLLQCIRIIIWNELEHLDIVNSLWCPGEDHKSTAAQPNNRARRWAEVSRLCQAMEGTIQSANLQHLPHVTFILSKMDANTCWKHLQIICNCPPQACVVNNYKDAHKAKRAHNLKHSIDDVWRDAEYKNLQRKKDQLYLSPTHLLEVNSPPTNSLLQPPNSRTSQDPVGFGIC